METSTVNSTQHMPISLKLNSYIQASQVMFDITLTGVALKMLEESAEETKSTFTFGTLVSVRVLRTDQMNGSPPVDVGNTDL